MKKYVVSFLAMGLLLVNCNTDDDVEQEQEQEQEAEVELNNEVNEFIWDAMNTFYLWQDEVLELGDDRFSSQNDYYSFLNSFDTERGLFQSLRSPKDRFSVIVEDYDILFNAFTGNVKINGVEFELRRPPSGGNAVIAIVRYIVPESNASETDIKRGDIIYAVNGTELFAETDADGRVTSSNLDLFNPDIITLNFADIENGQVVPNGVNIEVTKTEFRESPILISKTLDVQGTKVGYLMYNSFTRGFDEELNIKFGELNAENVSDLVLDLRYNSGGNVQSAQRLCSMITGQFTGEVLGRDIWNDKQNSIFGSVDLFVDTIDETPINSLNLDRVYIIATGESASASEYVLNNLAPYIDVIHVGDVTVGKNEISVTLVDNPGQDGAPINQPNLDLPYIVLNSDIGFTTVEDSNPNHRYALQPVVAFGENSEGFSDFTDGLVPDIPIEETADNLGQLGELSDPLLARAIEQITGFTAKSLQKSTSQSYKMELISSSEQLKPFSGLLVRDNFKDQ